MELTEHIVTVDSETLKRWKVKEKKPYLASFLANRKVYLKFGDTKDFETRKKAYHVHNPLLFSSQSILTIGQPDEGDDVPLRFNQFFAQNMNIGKCFELYFREEVIPDDQPWWYNWDTEWIEIPLEFVVASGISEEFYEMSVISKLNTLYSTKAVLDFIHFLSRRTARQNQIEDAH